MATSIERRRFLFGRHLAPGESPRPAARIGETCLETGGVVCRACGDACAARAILFLQRAGSAAKPLVDAARCTACGDCLAVCPAEAITLARPTP